MLDTSPSLPRSGRRGGGPCWWSSASWNSGPKRCWRWCRTAGRSSRSPAGRGCRARSCMDGCTLRARRLHLARRPVPPAGHLPPSDRGGDRGCDLRAAPGAPGWGPRRIAHQLAKTAIDPVPSRSSIYRCLKRHGLIELRRRRRRRDEFRRWERDPPLRLWQMDVMRGVDLSHGTELKVVTGIDDRSRFCVGAGLVARATSKTVCQVLTQSLACGIR
jgi:hypothetical protein